MSSSKKLDAHVNDHGHLILPPEMVSDYGLQEGDIIHIEQGRNGLRIRRPITQLAKVYIEPTNACNLKCRTCVRNVWDEPMGYMSWATFKRIIDGLSNLSIPPAIFFGGLGEPLSHPQIVEMVTQAKALAGSVELITNGTLLSEELSQGLIAAGLDVLWVSLDGARPESYADVRLGAALPDVLANIARFRDSRLQFRPLAPEIGIEFVAMKRNIADLPELLRLSRRLGVTRFLVSNVLPYTPEMCDELLYARALNSADHLPSPRLPNLCLPRMDIGAVANGTLYQEMWGTWNIDFAGNHSEVANNCCPFIEGGATAVGWDGRVSPCLPLLYSHTSFLNGVERFSRCYMVGNVNEHSLGDLWSALEYVEFRERVQAFEFSPCVFCGYCDQSGANEEDCYGNTFPTCGGCLWAQGVIQCP